MSKQFEKSLEAVAKSKQEGHDQFLKRIEKWGTEFDKKMKEIEKVNSQFLKEVNGDLTNIDGWFRKKEKQLTQLFRYFS
ncbi:hypothetical protein GGR02_003002 [Anoxybacillus voinovskiensis]|uniref:Uncharacterized protein n=1 Tax=Anoxybacteroides voinovskiense TaxID=230470 RepID=A0A840DUD2_9BACL|nr:MULTISPECIES: hypothetical protein [Anoxybacillus]MBB4075185.1 hypothetical protein [Anoxybacillus voinovskiensis]MCL6585322.1 hypothetical protein [Anoxybacillus sp.]GGJ76991.1 hypothetical protein GCM10008982_27910 [Anoxybacillus voinovskiensis]